MGRKKKEKEYELSKYQLDIIDFIKNGNGNLVVEASAGSGKSYTLIKCAEEIPGDKRILLSAFNRDIANVLKRKTKDMFNVNVSTLHGLGLQMLQRNFPNEELMLDEFKYKSYLNTNIRSLSSINTFNLSKREYVRYMSNIETFINFGRCYLCETVKDLEFIEDRYDIQPIADEKEVALDILAYGKKNLSQIDYTDMIWLPNVLYCKPIGMQYDWIFVDECLTYGTLISTSKGRVKLGKLVKDFLSHKTVPLIKSFNEKTGNFEYNKIVNAFDIGEKETMSITMNGKFKINCTYNHKFLTDNGYVYASDLKIGDICLSDKTSQPYHKLFSTDDEKDLFLISIIGDGSLHKISDGVYRCKFIHGESQKEFIEWKANILGIEKVRKIEKNGFSSKNAYTFSTKGYCIKNKFIDKASIINNMTLKQFAINYADNGSFQNNTMRLYSCVNDFDLVNLLKERIESFGIYDVSIHESKSSTTKRKYWYIIIGTKGSYKLSSLIAKYIHPCVSYKIHNDFSKEVGTYEWKKRIEGNVGATIVTSIEKNNEKQNVYDLEIENNHNFIVCSGGGSKVDISKASGVIVHNCQDLNMAQRELLLKCKKINTRMMSVGDSSQCLYSFSGADPESFKRLKELPNTTSLPLSISYRCAKNIVEFAHKIVPSIEANNDGREGEIKYDVSLEEIQDGDMVLCRNNAPLMQVYVDFIKKGKKCFIRGKDIGLNLKNMVKRMGIEKLNKSLQEDGVFVRLYDGLFDMINEIIGKYNVTYSDAVESAVVANRLDMIKALEILSDDINTATELIDKINNIFSDRKSGGISLSTIHKAKGLEADNVYIACKHLMPSSRAKKDWEIRQEYNLMYVAYTRAKNVLGFIDEKEFENFNKKTSETVNHLKKLENQVNYVLKKKKRKIEIDNPFIANDIIRHATKIDKPKTEYKAMPLMTEKLSTGIGFNDIFKRRLTKRK